MDEYYFIYTIIKNKSNEKKYRKYYFDFTTKNDKFILNYFKLNHSEINYILKLIIGNSLYFNINNDFYKADFAKTNYETIKRYNKVIFEIDASDIINIVKDNKFYYLYLVKKDKELNLLFINNGILNTYKYINKEFILQKKYMYFKDFLVDEDDKLFCIDNYEILSIKQFRHYNYIVDLVKCKYNTTKTISIYSTLFALYGRIYYRAYKDNNNEINLFLDGMFIGKNSINFKNNKIELSCENEFLLVI